MTAGVKSAQYYDVPEVYNIQSSTDSGLVFPQANSSSSSSSPPESVPKLYVDIDSNHFSDTGVQIPSIESHCLTPTAGPYSPFNSQDILELHHVMEFHKSGYADRAIDTSHVTSSIENTLRVSKLYLHVRDSPICVIVAELSSNMRLGHIMANAKDNNPHVVHVTTTITQVEDAGCPRKSHCPQHLCRGSIRAKVIAFSNAFRQALGFPIIEAHPHPEGKEIHSGLIRIMPFTGTPLDTHGEIQLKKPEHGHCHQFKHGHGLFLRRIHHALIALGP